MQLPIQIAVILAVLIVGNLKGPRVEADCLKPRMRNYAIDTLSCLCDELINFLPNFWHFTAAYGCDLLHDMAIATLAPGVKKKA